MDFTNPQNQSLHLLLSEELSKPDSENLREEAVNGISRLRVEQVADESERTRFMQHIFVEPHLAALQR